MCEYVFGRKVRKNLANINEKKVSLCRQNCSYVGLIVQN